MKPKGTTISFRNTKVLFFFYIPLLPVPYMFGTRLPVANISGIGRPLVAYIGNCKMRDMICQKFRPNFLRKGWKKTHSQSHEMLIMLID